MEPFPDLDEILRNNPEAFLIEDVLIEILRNRTFLDFITLISKYPFLYDRLQEKQGFWQRYYLQKYPHVDKTKLIQFSQDDSVESDDIVELDDTKEFSDDTSKLHKKINWFKQCCIESNVYFTNTIYSQIPSPFINEPWTTEILQITSQEIEDERSFGTTIPRGWHTVDEDENEDEDGDEEELDFPPNEDESIIHNLYLSRLNNIKQIICGKYNDSRIETIYQEKYVVILHEDGQLFYFSPVETTLLMKNVKKIVQIGNPKPGNILMIIIIYVDINNVYVLTIDNQGLFYIKKIICNVNMVYIFDKLSYGLPIFTFRNEKNNVFSVDLHEYFLQDFENLLKNETDIHIEFKSDERGVYFLYNPEYDDDDDNDEKQHLYYEGKLPVQQKILDEEQLHYEGKLPTQQKSIEKKHPDITHFYNYRLNIFSNRNNYIYLNSNKELHVIFLDLQYNNQYNYNLSKHDPVIKHLEIENVSQHNINNKIYTIIKHKEGITLLYLPLEFNRHNKIMEIIRDPIIYGDYGPENFYNIDDEITNSGIFEKYPIKMIESEIKDIIIVNKSLRISNKDIYILDISGYVYRVDVNYFFNNFLNKVFSNKDEHVKLIATNVINFLYNAYERIIGFEININRYIIVPYEHYLIYHDHGIIRREILYNNYIIFKLGKSEFTFKCFIPEKNR